MPSNYAHYRFGSLVLEALEAYRGRNELLDLGLVVKVEENNG